MDYSRSIGVEIRALSHLIKRYLDYTPEKKMADDITGTHGWIIAYLNFNSDKDIFQKDIEKEFSIRRSTVTRILQLMEKNGFIKRVAVESDARLKKIVLTEKSLELHRNIKANQEKLENTLKTGIDDKELQAFFSTIEKMKLNLAGKREENNN